MKIFKNFSLIFMSLFLVATLTLNLSAQSKKKGTKKTEKKQNNKKEKAVTFDDVVKSLMNTSVGGVFPLYDKQVNQIIRMVNTGKDIPGSITALVNLGVSLGNDIDIDEEKTIIRGSKIDTSLYKDITKTIVNKLKKNLNSSIVEANNIIQSLEANKGVNILKGIKLSAKISYKIENSKTTLITPQKLNLWFELGQVDSKKLLSIYSSLLKIGLDPVQNDISVNSLLILSHLKGDVVSIIKSLGTAKWRVEGELDDREISIIKNMVENKYTGYSKKTETTISK